MRVTYNPYRAGFFYVAAGPHAGREVVGADAAWMDAEGRSVHAYGLKYGERNAYGE